MANTGNAPAPPPGKRATPGNDAGFKRVYQACDNCRQKKQKCLLGDPSNPRPPCQNCRRANLACTLPERKRRGRPPKKARGPAAADQDDGMRSQPSWQTFMGSFEPVVGTGEASPQSSHSSITHAQPQASSHDQRMASQTLATFPLRNTSDAIRLLDQAEGKPHPEAADLRRSNHVSDTGASIEGASRPPFFLLQEGLIDEATLLRLFRFYLVSVHSIMPLIPYKRMPITSYDMLDMASREPHLMAAILVVTASLESDRSLHDLLWRRVQSVFAEIAIMGADAPLEVMEGLLLLSEYPPNMGHGSGLGFEDRMCWMTVGTAVRLGYLLGLEQLSMQADDVEQKMVDNRDRGKVAWSYCYLLDRQISIRAGKVFWHRSPGMTYQHHHTDPADDFPEMRDIPGVQDDYASYMQCLIQITQIVTNAHDLLYPSKSRSAAMAKAEQYYKNVDEFGETLAAFRYRWQKKPWRTYPINECVWISFHHLRLYIYSFSLQAHMLRSSGNGEGTRPVNYFPTGLMGSTDARFIIEAINAAADILRLAIGRLQPSKTLSYLPLRFFLYLSHAGVFLLKAVLVVPLPPSQKRAILRLVRALVGCLSTASSDPKHPAMRYASGLGNLLRRIYRDRDLQTPDHTSPPSPREDLDNSIHEHTTMPSRPSQENTLPTFLENRESSFVAERPLQDLANDMDALFGTPNATDLNLQGSTENDFSILPPSDPFASLLNPDERDFWDTFTSTAMDWDAI